MIEDDRKSWNSALIQQICSVDIASEILSSSLADQVHHDRLVWKVENNGLYSVKSAYRFCVEELVDTSHMRKPVFGWVFRNCKSHQKLST